MAFQNPTTALELYEQLLAVRFRTQHAFAVASEQDAFYAALAVANIGKGSEVIVPVLADRSAVEPLLKVGATPVFCDVIPNTNFLDPKHLKQLVGPTTSAIMTVPMWGAPATGSDELALAERMNIPLLNYATHGIGAQTMWQSEGAMGTIGFMGSASNPAYNIGKGGIITTKDNIIAEKLSLLNLKKLDEETAEQAATRIQAFGENRDMLYRQGNLQTFNFGPVLDYMKPLFYKGSAVHSMAYNEYVLDSRVSALMPAHEVADFVEGTNLIQNYAPYKIKLLTFDTDLSAIHKQRPHISAFDDFPNAKATRDSLLVFPVIPGSTDETWGPLAEMIYNKLPKPYEPSFDVSAHLYSNRCKAQV